MGNLNRNHRRLKEIRAEDSLRPMAQRNLKIALALRPKIADFRNKLGYDPIMSPQSYLQWKQTNAETIRKGLTKLMKNNSLPTYQMPIVDWLFDASEDEIVQLKSYIKKPIGRPPRAYYLLYSPAHEFDCPLGYGWPQEAGYRVAVLRKEKEGYWQIWGDLRDLPGESWWSFLKQSGDFIIRGNLETFDVESWRRIGKLMSSLKMESQMGRKLALVPGGRKGVPKRPKTVMDKMTWKDIQNVVAQDARQYNRLLIQYAGSRRQVFVERYKAKNDGASPPAQAQKRERQKAINNFTAHCGKARQK